MGRASVERRKNLFLRVLFWLGVGSVVLGSILIIVSHSLQDPKLRSLKKGDAERLAQAQRNWQDYARDDFFSLRILELNSNVTLVPIPVTLLRSSSAPYTGQITGVEFREELDTQQTRNVHLTVRGTQQLMVWMGQERDGCVLLDHTNNSVEMALRSGDCAGIPVGRPSDGKTLNRFFSSQDPLLLAAELNILNPSSTASGEKSFIAAIVMFGLSGVFFVMFLMMFITNKIFDSTHESTSRPANL